MRPIDADVLQNALAKEYIGISGHKTREKFYQAIEIVRQQPTITPPPNDPLTLEELREMDGEPVWVVPINIPDEKPSWMQVMPEFGIVARHESIAKSRYARFEGYGAEWLAYRCKPEEGTI